VRLALTDLRSGVVRLHDDPFQPPTPVVPSPPGLGSIAPYGVARLHDGRLVFADRLGHRIIAMNEDGSDVASFGVLGAGDGKLRAPCGVAVAPDGRIYVADTGNRRVVAVDAMDGSGWQAYGVKGGPTEGDAAVGRFAYPVALAADAAGLLVADPGAARVVRLSTLDDAGWDASSPGVLRNPVDVAVLPGGGFVVADLSARRLAFFHTPSGGVTFAVGHPLLAGPSAVVAATEERLAVCVAPLAALFAVILTDGVWTVVVERRLAESGLRRPVALCLLP
jgi:DNA-binding beta-propeller fold protein YncE